jgi:hypothetical protein
MAPQLFDDRVEWLSPVFVRIIHHDVDEHRNQKTEDLSTIKNLRPVDATVPG